MTPIYLHDWAYADAAQGQAAVAIDFAIHPDTLKGVDILLASYTYENYSGDAFVLFRKDGALYEVNGGHCSCYGLEGQWGPEATTIPALRMRLERGSGNGQNEYKTALAQVLDALESDGPA